MRLHDLKPAPGSRKSKKRVGRGPGSGHGKTCGRGMKGQKARAGDSIPPYFEGGQMSLVHKIPKRGFKNIFKKVYAIVNVGDLERFEDGTVVTPDLLRQVRLIKGRYDGVKILGDGELSRRLEVHAHKFSKSAEEKIKTAGGKVVVI